MVYLFKLRKEENFKGEPIDKMMQLSVSFNMATMNSFRSIKIPYSYDFLERLKVKHVYNS